MSTKTVCDLCDDDAALKPATGFHVVIIRKISKDDGESQSYNDVEYDACGACMQKIRKVCPVIK
jgi:hypothetical protein